MIVYPLTANEQRAARKGSLLLGGSVVVAFLFLTLAALIG